MNFSFCVFDSVDVQYSMSQVDNNCNTYDSPEGFERNQPTEHSSEDATLADDIEVRSEEEERGEGYKDRRSGCDCRDSTVVELNGSLSMPWILHEFVNRTAVESYSQLLDNLEMVIKQQRYLC